MKKNKVTILSNERLSRWSKIWKSDEWVRPYIFRYKWTLILAVVLGILTFVCGGALMFTSGYLISKAATKPENILLIYIPIVLTRAFGILRPIFRYIERLVSHNWVLKMTSDLRLKVYTVVENQTTAFKSKFQSGEILGLLTEDIHHIQNLYLRSFFPTAVGWGLSFVLFLAMGFVDWKMAILLLLFFLVLLIGFPFWAVMANSSRRAIQKKWRNYFYTQLTDNVLGVGDWVFSQRGSDYVSHYKAEEIEMRQIDKKIAEIERLISLALHISAGVFSVILIVWSSYFFGGQGFIEANWIAAFVLVLFPLIDAFSPLPNASEEIENHIASLERMGSLSFSRIHKKAVTIDKIHDFNIVVSDMTYCYNLCSKPTLFELSLYVPERQKVAILGKSGSGKSTLLNLLHGDLSPASGKVLFGGYASHEISDISQLIGSLDQSPYLFNTTVGNNVRIGNESATDKQIIEVLNKVGLDKLIVSLPHGLDTNVDEAGLRFSGGERHRLAIARLLLQDAPIILLDEPCVALDSVTENQLMDMIFSFFDDRTIVWVTHHLQNIEKVDRVIFIENGNISMDGPPGKLYHTNDKFKRLYNVENRF